MVTEAKLRVSKLGIKILSHLSKVIVTTMWLFRGWIPRQLATVTVGKEFNTELSTVIHVKTT